MSLNLISTNRNVDNESRAKSDWAAITAISAADATSPYPTEGYVTVSPEAIVSLAAALDGAVLTNGEMVTTYDFTHTDEGRTFFDAHINAFGPSLLQPQQLATLRETLAPFPHAIAMLDLIIERDLQISLSTTDYAQSAIPHLKGVNWQADEVEINATASTMHTMLESIGLGQYLSKTEESGEVEFDTFAKAVNDNSHKVFAISPDRLGRFVANGLRHGATHVYWA